MKHFLSIVLAIFSLQSFGQQFEPGYIITSNGEKKEVLIKNADWQNSPASFKYQINNSASTETATLESIKPDF